MEAKKRLAQGMCLLLAVILIGAGTFREELRVVFMKASNVCMECIGLG